MAHIHELFDFVVSVFIVHVDTSRVLLVHHKKLNAWVPVGGHIELDELPDLALAREIGEETGLIVGKEIFLMQYGRDELRTQAYNKLQENKHNAQLQLTPLLVEVHDFTPVPNHKHIALTYGAVSTTDNVRLESTAHNDIRWFSLDELRALPDLEPRILIFAEECIKMAHGKTPT